jgi:uncharacterized protein YjiS (DUF1127 family)
MKDMNALERFRAWRLYRRKPKKLSIIAKTEINDLALKGKYMESFLALLKYSYGITREQSLSLSQKKADALIKAAIDAQG